MTVNVKATLTLLRWADRRDEALHPVIAGQAAETIEALQAALVKAERLASDAVAALGHVDRERTSLLIQNAALHADIISVRAKAAQQRR